MSSLLDQREKKMFKVSLHYQTCVDKQARYTSIIWLAERVGARRLTSYEDIRCQRGRRPELVRMLIIVSYQGYIRVFRERKMCLNRCTMSEFTWHMMSRSSSWFLLLVWSSAIWSAATVWGRARFLQKFSLFQLFFRSRKPAVTRTAATETHSPHSNKWGWSGAADLVWIRPHSFSFSIDTKHDAGSWSAPALKFHIFHYGTSKFLSRLM